MYETKALVALARAWRDDPVRTARVRDAVRWVAHEHATPDTHVLGEAWVRTDGDVVAAVGQPHTLTGLLFYEASLQAFPPGDGDGDEDGDREGAEDDGVEDRRAGPAGRDQ
jgi:hypothetical protein